MGEVTADREVERIWREFWLPIVTGETGEVDLEIVKKELYDFHTMLQAVPIVYDHVTGGQISKPLTAAVCVTHCADEHYQRLHEEDPG